jgi:arylsulfatase
MSGRVNFGGGKGEKALASVSTRVHPWLIVFQIIIWSFALAIRCFIAGAAPLPPPPNIIFVLTDDQGYGDLSCHGNPILKTPHLDAFHRESMRFTDFHVSPTCAPTRAALLTGRHEFRNGVTHTIFERERLTTNAITLAQMLKGAGYTTGIFGKWHLGDEPEYQPNRRGFDEVFIHGSGGIGQTYPGSCGDAPGNRYFDPTILHNGRFERTKGYCTDVFFDQALQWMDARRGGSQPFFAYIALNAPHAPLDGPPDYERLYAGKVGTNAAKFFGMIANIDDNFGKLTARLREWNLETNTLVIFMTDNGGTAGVPVFNAGMRGGKNTPYVGGTRVPSFWRWPGGFQGGTDCRQLTAHIDVFPTLTQIAGVPPARLPANQVEGRSLLPLLKNPEATWAERILVTHIGRWERGQASEAQYRNCSIRTARFQMVSSMGFRDDGTQPRWELFDLQNDPGEKQNVIHEHRALAQRLARAYDQWWKEVQPGLVNENVTGPKVNPFKALYWKQFGGGPDAALRKRMDPATTDFK